MLNKLRQASLSESRWTLLKVSAVPVLNYHMDVILDNISCISSIKVTIDWSRAGGKTIFRSCGWPFWLWPLTLVQLILVCQGCIIKLCSVFFKLVMALYRNFMCLCCSLLVNVDIYYSLEWMFLIDRYFSIITFIYVL